MKFNRGGGWVTMPTIAVLHLVLAIILLEEDTYPILVFLEL